MMMNQQNNSKKTYRIGTRRYRSKLTLFSGKPDLTALVDIMFLMLVFFMLSSSFVQVSGIQVDLPKADTSNSTDIEKFIITMEWKASGPALVYFNDNQVDNEMLKEKLAELSGLSRTATVVLRVDNRIPFQEVAEIMTLAERADLATFIAVMPPQNAPDAVFTPQR